MIGFIHKPIISILLIVIIGLLSYSNTFKGPFVFDDTPNIVENPLIKDLRYLTDTSTVDNSSISREMKDFFRPRLLGYLTFTLNYKLNGLDTTGYHVFNTVIHLINAILIYWLAHLIFTTPFFLEDNRHKNSLPTNEHDKTRVYNFIALMSALVFVSHPIQTQAVTYIVQRFASLATLFYLLSLTLYVKARLTETGRTAYVLCMLSTLSAIFAMKTKEIAFTIPFTITMLELMFFKGNIKKRLTYIMPIALTLLIIPVSHMGNVDNITGLNRLDEAMKAASDKSMSRWQYLITQFRVMVTYIRLMLLPVNQNIDYDYTIYKTFLTPEVAISFLLLLSLFALSLYLYRLSVKQTKTNNSLLRLISFGILWWFITLSVESSIIPIRDVIFEHRVYLPSIGFIFALISSFFIIHNTFFGTKAATQGILLAVSIVIILSAATYKRNYIWQDEVRLWEDTVQKSPNKIRPHNSLGGVYMRHGRFDDAIKEYKAALTVEPGYAETYFNIGCVYSATARVEEAVKAYKTAIELNSNYAEAHNNLGAIYDDLGRLEEAVSHYTTAIAISKNFAEAHNNLGKAYDKQGRQHDAINEFKAALRLKPDYPMAYNNLGNVYFKQGRFDEAASHYNAALQIDPNFSLARQNLELLPSSHLIPR
ncbi:MAG: tetratricopeptide repeat protein [Nitrospirae bacterium]|nr:tetratricopeptide repeat protein [Nitrospirota bacterium]